MFRRIKVRYASKSASMVSVVQEMNVNLSENDNGVCIWTTEYIISYSRYN